MPDGNNSPDVNYSSLGQGNGKTLSNIERTGAPEVDPMAHATRLEEGNPADRSGEEELLKMLKNFPEEKPITPSKAVEEKPKKKEQKQLTKTDPDRSEGFLMPFVNGFNGLIGNVWNALKSLIPMKQTGTGSA